MELVNGSFSLCLWLLRVKRESLFVDLVVIVFNILITGWFSVKRLSIVFHFPFLMFFYIFVPSKTQRSDLGNCHFLR